ncbi:MULTISPECIES: TetR/AcrR family transcriptional regulator [Streptomyces]|uniref:TetR/AcrR family transcriptional regulator n=1 Tax=Streptomyces TaxID=1883 RepID=UPI00163C55EB|nr:MULTISPECIES: TetR/AcrR family transcriptional regulator [Streptomyces]MBC2875260.1 TetR family transcriptional regulator [Streptomyces sp. TYQ1024]UBI37085.1 TetR/AcrR family transcriptional regulator [Streptomyces mobaraensis]UKW29681.1 TetR/AcrR family transcriptional regulator [Streptomyces sp. TYQ1024]
MTLMASAQTSPTTQPGPRLGLRERKKIQTRQAIRDAAYRLFEEQGYDATPVDQIAEAADVSPSTVFRYFPTKEDIVLTDEYDPLLEAALRSRPADEPPLRAIRNTVLEGMRDILGTASPEMRMRNRLIRDVPSLRARASEGVGESARLLRSVLAERTGRPEDDFELRVVTTAVLVVMQEAVMVWVDEGQAGDPLDYLRRALDVLERGLAL